MRPENVPVYVRVGNLDEHQVGTITWTNAEMSQAELAKLLRAVADEVEKQLAAEHG